MPAMACKTGNILPVEFTHTIVTYIVALNQHITEFTVIYRPKCT